MPQAFLGLGSNIGDRMKFLQDAVKEIPDLVGVSGVYETDPIGGPDQSKFLNIVVELETELDPRGLLNLAQTLERKANRRREVHWGPRTLDVDVLWVDGQVVNDPDLIVPPISSPTSSWCIRSRSPWAMSLFKSTYKVPRTSCKWSPIAIGRWT